MTPSETSGTKSANAAEPKVVRTPAVRFRSLIAVGTPHSGESGSASTWSAVELGRPVAGQVGRERDERADRVESVGAFEVVIGELERRHLAATHQLALLERGQVMEFGHDPTVASWAGQAAAVAAS